MVIYFVNTVKLNISVKRVVVQDYVNMGNRNLCVKNVVDLEYVDTEKGEHVVKSVGVPLFVYMVNGSPVV